jgi:hypothetical protein
MKRYIFLVAIIISMVSCKSKLKPRELGNYVYKTASVDVRNTQILVTAWGKGMSDEEALAEAKRNAIYDILYKGILDGNPSVRFPAIFLKNNAEALNSSFNAQFFSKDGPYLQYASLYDKAISQSRSKKIRKASRVLNSAIEYQILVDRNKLIQDLKAQNLL